MANQEQLEILRSGVEAWNKWREANPEVRADLIEADLSGADLSRARISSTTFGDVDLSTALRKFIQKVTVISPLSPF